MKHYLNILAILIIASLMAGCSSTKVMTPEEKQLMKIKRGETCQLLLNSTAIDELEWSYEKKSPRSAKDVDGHAYEDDIEEILQLSLRGLTVDSDGKFRPDDPLRRFELALIYEDVLIRSRRDPELATKYVGSESPFEDLKNDRFYYNAVRTAQDAKLLSLGGKAQAYPEDSVNMAEADILIQRLNDLLTE